MTADEIYAQNSRAEYATPRNGAPNTPSDIYRVWVLRLIPGTNEQWTRELDIRTSAQSPLGAMQGVLASETAKEMFRNQKAIDEV